MSRRKVTCIAYGFEAPTALTSSRLCVDQDDRHIGRLFAAAAFEVASSPCG